MAGTILSLLFVMLLGFYLRLKPRIKIREAGEDTYCYLLVADFLRKGGKVSENPPNFLIGEINDYPPVIFILLSLFPKKFLERYHFIFSPLVDSLNILLLYIITFIITKSTLIATTAGLIYAIIPQLIDECFTLNSRPLGWFMFNLVALSLVFFSVNNNLVFLFLSIIFGIFLLFTHKIEVPLMIILFILFAFVETNYLYLIALGTIFLGAILISKGHYINILKGHISIMRFWIRNWPHYGKNTLEEPANPHNSEGNIKEKGFFYFLEETIQRSWAYRWVCRYIPSNPFYITLLLVPFLFKNIDNPYTVKFWTWGIVIFLVFLAASNIKKLGQSPGRTQYLEYGTFPIAILTSFFLLQGAIHNLYLPQILVSFLAFISLFSIKQTYRGFGRSMFAILNDDLLQIFDYLKNLKEERIMCIPTNHFYPVAYFCNKKIVYPLSATAYNKLEEFFPIIRVPLEELVEEYGVELLLLDGKRVPIEKFNLNNLEILKHKGVYYLLKIKRIEGEIGPLLKDEGEWKRFREKKIEQELPYGEMADKEIHGEIRRILVLRSARMWQVNLVLRDLKRRFPDSTIDVLSQPQVVDELRGSTDVDNIIIFNKNRFTPFKTDKELKEDLKNGKYDLVVVVYSNHSGIGYFNVHLFVWRTVKAKRIALYTPSDFKIILYSRIYWLLMKDITRPLWDVLIILFSPLLLILMITGWFISGSRRILVEKKHPCFP